MNATPEERAQARALLLNLDAMRAVHQAALDGDRDALDNVLPLCLEEYNAGAPAVSLITGEITHADGVARKSMFANVIFQ